MRLIEVELRKSESPDDQDGQGGFRKVWSCDA
jgi:hypothetical protein